MINGELLTLEGFNKILSIRSSLNLGLSDKLKAEFSTIVAMERPISSLPLELEIKDYNPYWLVGFSEGDRSFFVGLTKSALYKAGYPVSLRFLISQHNRDISLMENIAKYLNCGNAYNEYIVLYKIMILTLAATCCNTTNRQGIQGQLETYRRRHPSVF